MRKLLALVCFAVLPLSAQAPATPADALACEALRHKGNSTYKACYQRLTGSTDPAVRAEGLWGVGDYRSANDAFRDALKLRPKDPAPRVRWGRMYLDHWQAGEARDLFKEAVGLKEDYAPALLGMALVAGEQFESQAIKSAKITPSKYIASIVSPVSCRKPRTVMFGIQAAISRV